MKKILLFSCCWLSAGFATAHSGDILHEEIQVYGRKHNLIGQAVSASEGKVSQQEIAQRPLLRTGEILETVPGLVATQHSGSGKANQYFLRGFNLDHGTDFATSIDRMPINMRTHGHGQGYTDLNFIIPELVGELTYKKGPYYVDVGDFSGTGSAEMQTVHTLPQQKVELGVGQDSFARLLAIGGADSTESHFFYGLELQRYDGPWDNIDEDIDKTNLWLKHAWTKGNDYLDLTFMAYDNSWNAADQIPERAVEQGLISQLGSIDTTVGGESSRYSVSAHWIRQLDNANLDAAFYYIDYDLNLWSNFTYFTNPDGDQFQQVDKRRIAGGDIRYQQNGLLGTKPSTNIYGTQLRYDDIAEVGLLNSRERVPTDVYRLDAVEQYSLGAWWENTTRWTDRFRTVVGLRHDYFSFSVDTLDARIPATLDANDGTADDTIVTGSLSLIHAFNDNYESYFSVGRGFHSNDARGTTIRLDPNTGIPIDKVDPLVSTLGYETGLRAFVSDKLNASIALWQLEIDSELLFVGDEGVTEDTGVGSKRNGVELTAYYYVDDVWTLDLEYAYTDAKFEEAVDGGDNIPGALDTVISAGINTQWNDYLYSHLRLRYFGDYLLDGGTPAQDSTLANLRIGYEPFESFSLALDVLNLFDSNDRDIQYFYESQLAAETQAVGDVHYHVFEPRSVRVYLSYRY